MTVYVPRLETNIAKGIVAQRMPGGPPMFMWLSCYAPHVGLSTVPDDCINVHGLGVKSRLLLWWTGTVSRVSLCPWTRASTRSM
jgi:hypothetical protein